MDATLHKTILVVVLFGIFVVLANLFHTRSAAAFDGRLHRRRRRRDGAGEGAVDVDPPGAAAGGLLSRWSLWASLGALALCVLALVLMWLATLAGAGTGSGEVAPPPAAPASRRAARLAPPPAAPPDPAPRQAAPAREASP